MLVGFGAGNTFMPLLTIALAEVPTEDAGLASGMVNVSMQLSAALGLAVLGSVSSGRTALLLAQGVSPTTSLIDGFQLAFIVAGVCVAIGLVVSQVILRSATPKAEAVVELERESWIAQDAA